MRTMKELAILYYPHTSVRYASVCLRRDIKEYPQLLRELEEANWRSSRSTVTPRQEAIIRHYLGTPLGEL